MQKTKRMKKPFLILFIPVTVLAGNNVESFRRTTSVASIAKHSGQILLPDGNGGLTPAKVDKISVVIGEKMPPSENGAEVYSMKTLLSLYEKESNCSTVESLTQWIVGKLGYNGQTKTINLFLVNKNENPALQVGWTEDKVDWTPEQILQTLLLETKFITIDEDVTGTVKAFVENLILGEGSTLQGIGNGPFGIVTVAGATIPNFAIAKEVAETNNLIVLTKTTVFEGGKQVIFLPGTSGEDGFQDEVAKTLGFTKTAVMGTTCYTREVPVTAEEVSERVATTVRNFGIQGKTVTTVETPLGIVERFTQTSTSEEVVGETQAAEEVES